PRAYRDGVRYAWCVPALALALREPARVPPWATATLLRARSDRPLLVEGGHTRMVRMTFWMPRTCCLKFDSKIRDALTFLITSTPPSRFVCSTGSRVHAVRRRVQVFLGGAGRERSRRLGTRR